MKFLKRNKIESETLLMQRLFNKLTLSQTLIMSLLVVGILPALTVGIISTYIAQEALTQRSYDQLETVRSIKSNQIESFFQERKGDLGVLVDLVSVQKRHAEDSLNQFNKSRTAKVENYLYELKTQLGIFSESYIAAQAVDAFSDAFSQHGQTTDSFAWGQAELNYGSVLDSYTLKFGWLDIYLISLSGDIVYSSSRAADLGKNVASPALSDTGLGLAYTRAANANDPNAVYFGDVAPYPPASKLGFDTSAAFFLSPIADKNSQISGYVAMRFPLERLSRLLIAGKAHGNTAQSYLIGMDKQLRSDARTLSLKDSLTDNKQHNSGIVNDAIEAKEGISSFRDADGRLVFGAWRHLDVDDETTWVVISEQDITKELIPVGRNDEEFFKNYIEKYNYYDLFLIAPDGEVFYTATKEADYKSNLISGKFSGSNLARLFRDVKSSKEFQFIDFEPYAPSNGLPSSFVAGPVFDNDGSISLVVALQLSIDAINSVMQVREGMGESGESYLVGPDFKMRSNSYLDPINRTVEASFAGTVEVNGVRTVASQEALKGHTGAQVIDDYNGNPVLSSYAPLRVGNLVWGLIAEIDESEAFSSVYDIRNNLIVLLGLAIISTSLFAAYLARTIKRPLGGEPRDMMHLAQKIAAGDLTHQFEDKVAPDSLNGALKEMTQELKRLVESILTSSQTLASTAEETSVASEQTTKAIVIQNSDTEQVATAINQMSATTSEVATNTNSAADASKKAQQKSDEGQRILQTSIDSVSTLVEDVHDTRADMQLLQERSVEINKVLEVIQGITEQTNLLALNAAIEAARAGESGRGFAVVADEVRQLAQRSQSSADDIHKMIESIQEVAESANTKIERSNEHATLTTQLAQQTQEAFVEISSLIETVDDIMLQVSTASQEQAHVTEDISKNIQHISEISEQTSVSSEELSSASREVARSAEELSELTSRFKV